MYIMCTFIISWDKKCYFAIANPGPLVLCKLVKLVLDENGTNRSQRVGFQ